MQIGIPRPAECRISGEVWVGWLGFMQNVHGVWVKLMFLHSVWLNQVKTLDTLVTKIDVRNNAKAHHASSIIY